MSVGLPYILKCNPMDANDVLLMRIFPLLLLPARRRVYISVHKREDINNRGHWESPAMIRNASNGLTK